MHLDEMLTLKSMELLLFSFMAAPILHRPLTKSSKLTMIVWLLLFFLPCFWVVIWFLIDSTCLLSRILTNPTVAVRFLTLWRLNIREKKCPFFIPHYIQPYSTYIFLHSLTKQLILYRCYKFLEFSAVREFFILNLERDVSWGLKVIFLTKLTNLISSKN